MTAIENLQAYLPSSFVIRGEGETAMGALKDFETKLLDSLKDLPAGYIAMWRGCPEFRKDRDFAEPFPSFTVTGRWFPAPVGALLHDTALYVTPTFPYWSMSNAD